MAPRKEPKEQIYYPPSKQKVAPYRPPRPSNNVPRTSTTDSERSNPKQTTKAPPAKRQKTSLENDDEDEIDQGAGAAEIDSDDSEDLPADPLTARPSKATKRPTPKRKPAQRQASPMSISSEEANSPQRAPADPDPPPGSSQSDSIPTIPQPLLVRLLHEHFSDQKTKIDKDAIQVLQKYFEVFIRETIARAALQKKEHVDQDGLDEADASWLELEDLEKVAAAMVLDF